MRRTLCSSCSTYFSSTAEFDAHRTGLFGHDRRCMTLAEMERAGFASEKHVITDETGRPTRRVWFRAGPRLKRAETRAAEAAIGIQRSGSGAF